VADSPRIAGVRAARLHRRLRLSAGVALGVAAAALLVSTLRPLPKPDGVEALAPAAAPPPPALGGELASRERRLTTLSGAGNIFAADRRPWPADAPDPEAIAEVEPESQPPDRPPQVAQRNEPPAIEEIRLTDQPTAAATQSIEKLSLRGVLASGGRRLAMIAGGVPRQRDDVELYREGDVFLKDTWRVIRIDSKHDRVILEHLGQGDVLALSMYDSPFAAAPQAASDDGTTVVRATEFEARREMLDAGVERSDVDDLMEMVARLERGEDVEAEPDEQEPAVAATPEEPAAEPGTRRAPQEMPAGMAELLKAMMQDAARSRGAERRDEPAPETPEQTEESSG
jgi:hypothetical protein